MNICNTRKTKQLLLLLALCFGSAYGQVAYKGQLYQQ